MTTAPTRSRTVEGVTMADDGIPWLTDPQRDFLAHLSVITIQPQLKPVRS
jgi:hypothetical protein